jgi:O-antigen/teichoic acid export membrane protein
VPTVSKAALSFLLGQAAAAIAGAVVVLRLIGIPPMPRSAAMSWQLFRMALPLMLIWFLSDLYLRVDTTILYYLRGDRETGLYGASYRLVEGVYSAAIVVCSVSLPRMAAAWSSDMDRWRQEWRRTWQLLLLIVVPAGALLFLGSGPIVQLLYGVAFADAVASLRILGPSTIVLGLGTIYGAALTSTGREMTQLGITLAALIANVILNLLWIPPYGGKGAALATLASAFGYVTLAHVALQQNLARGRRARL